jgi:hypothetical protein
MIKLIAASLASLLIAGSMIQTATAGQRIAKRHYGIAASNAIRNANASLASNDTNPTFARPNRLRNGYLGGQDDQQSRPSIYPRYLRGAVGMLVLAIGHLSTTDQLSARYPSYRYRGQPITVGRGSVFLSDFDPRLDAISREVAYQRLNSRAYWSLATTLTLREVSS